jgi:hypothetical protein
LKFSGAKPVISFEKMIPALIVLQYERASTSASPLIISRCPLENCPFLLQSEESDSTAIVQLRASGDRRPQDARGKPFTGRSIRDGRRTKRQWKFFDSKNWSEA